MVEKKKKTQLENLYGESSKNEIKDLNGMSSRGITTGKLITEILSGKSDRYPIRFSPIN